MLTQALIRKLFTALNAELKKKGVIGEIGICGGAVMCLVFNARASTKDVDGIFEPTQEIREAAREAAKRCNLQEEDTHWLNDAAKAYFFKDPPKTTILELSHLRVWAPSPEYMLAMKCFSARFDGHDKEDVHFLLKHLKIKTPEAALEIVETYCPKKLVPPQTELLIRELLQ